ncbi:MAG: MtnX-like HAD-IB family phosphatase [Chloroflexi bacterium]|nr:MtnX-like HAD-IB family phosphatase [Chloroflexota bacterium]
MKTLVQCDFDGTITREDISFLLLDEFATDNWRRVLDDYRENRIPIGLFNARAFAMVKADEPTLVEFVRRKAEIRPGFDELLAFCRRSSFRLVIVSNGLDFYINTILRDIGAADIEVFAARTRFSPAGIEPRYIGPDGDHLQDSFKEGYTRLFLSQGYRVIYVGNGRSDVSPARLAHRVFATSEMLECCQKMNISCTPFTDLCDVVMGLETAPVGQVETTQQPIS